MHALPSSVPGAWSKRCRFVPVDGDHHWLESQTAPAEPHAFTAKLHLDAGGQSEELPFTMTEPEDHHA
jgi:hypothetical protein